MSNRASLTRQADAKGRITLGPAFAHTLLFVEERADEVILRRGRVIPERESWLYENPRALASVRKGLAQARAGKFVKGPDLRPAKKIADKARARTRPGS